MVTMRNVAAKQIILELQRQAQLIGDVTHSDSLKTPEIQRVEALIHDYSDDVDVMIAQMNSRFDLADDDRRALEAEFASMGQRFHDVIAKADQVANAVPPMSEHLAEIDIAQDRQDAALQAIGSQMDDLSHGKADRTALDAKADRTDLTNLATKADIAPLANKADRSEFASLASTAFVQGEIAKLLGTATPATLDTLKEIADALGNDPQLAQHLTAQIAAKQDASPILAALAGLVLAEGAMVYATGKVSFATAPSTVFGRSVLAIADAAAARTLFGAASATDVTRIQRTRATTAADGTYTWIFPSAYPANVIPIVSVEAETNTSRPVVAQIMSVNNTQVTIRCSRNKAISVAVLGVGVEAFEAPGAISVHLMAVAP